MLDSIAPILEHWYIWLPLLIAIALCYVLERVIRKKKVIFAIINLILHTGLIVLFFVLNIGIECSLLLILIAVLFGVLI